MEYYLTVSAALREEQGLLEKGTELASAQFKLPFFQPVDRIEVSGKVDMDESEERLTLKADGVSIGFDKRTGALCSYRVEGSELIKEAIRPNFWRPVTDNDMGADLNVTLRSWRLAGTEAELVSMERAPMRDGYLVSSLYRLPVGESSLKMDYNILADGCIDVACSFVPGNDTLPLMPRFGVTLTLDKRFDKVEWLGRGPHENYIDRRTSAYVGLYGGYVRDQYFLYDRPQETGNKTEVRWMSLRNPEGIGLMAIGMPYLSASTYDFPNSDLDEPGTKKSQRHISDIVSKDMVTWNIDWRQMGVGGDTSWGAFPHPQYLIPASHHVFSFRLCPIKEGQVKGNDLYLRHDRYGQRFDEVVR